MAARGAGLQKVEEYFFLRHVRVPGRENAVAVAVLAVVDFGLRLSKGVHFICTLPVS